MFHIFFIHSSVKGHLGCFHVLAMVNSAAMNTGAHVSFRIRAFVFSRYMPRSGIAGSYVMYIHNFNDEMYTHAFPIKCSQTLFGSRFGISN